MAWEPLDVAGLRQLMVLLIKLPKPRQNATSDLPDLTRPNLTRPDLDLTRRVATFDASQLKLQENRLVKKEIDAKRDRERTTDAAISR